MKNMEIKYGSTCMSVAVEEENLIGVIEANKLSEEKTEEEVIKDALENPIGSARLKELVHDGERVCVVIPDVTRAWQKTDKYLNAIVEELNAGGIEDKNIVFISALGSHRKQTREEHEKLLGEKLSERFKVIDHDCYDKENLVYLGETTYGNRVYINRIAMECDHIVITGGIVYHLLAGYAGGKKTILPGISGAETIMKNHSLSLNDNLGESVKAGVCSGGTEDNPVHLDMLEAASFVKPTFMFNVIMGPEGQIAAAVAGNYIAAHEQGMKILKNIDGVDIEEKADLVIASAGGYPKDINLYQSVKTLTNAREAVKEGGYIIAALECREGLGGDKNIQDLILNYDNILDREKFVRDDFTISKFIAYCMCETAYKFKVILVSDIKQELVKNANITVVKTVEKALEIVHKEKGENLKTYVMPHAANTLPMLTK
ncbi:nickel-dependent lactate racemase [Clostridium sp. PL3]|uniref:Nickel-dependent lactate racemase n=1 Tax=Clostridium thailandense TaxID=2794346 RepID=A0A949U4N8_9CLOT|nr:nickel-dependent lactate racemase [Clostridium thailandense]MBV7276374.1 nickel-dependent lactate racemase [Clostridium thailandense]